MSCLEADGVVAGKGKSIASLLAKHGVEVTLYDGPEGKNVETGLQVKWLKMGDESVECSYNSPKFQMTSNYAVSPADLDFILNGEAPSRRVSFGSGPARHRDMPAQVIIDIHDGAGRDVAVSVDDEDAQYGLGHLFKHLRRVGDGGATILTIGCKYLGGGSVPAVLVRRTQDQGGSSRWTQARRVRNVEAYVRAGCSNAEADALMALLLQRTAAYQEFDEMLKDKGSDDKPFTEAESKFIMHIAGTKNVYRELASVLRRKFGRRVLTPIDQINRAVDSNLSPATPGVVWIDVEEEALDKDMKKKVKTTRKMKVEFWCINNVAAEVVLELNAIGKTFRRRRIANEDDTIWLLFGGDKGGKPESSFKMGFIVLNQENPLSPLNVRLTGILHGPDSRDVLSKTVMTPAVAAQFAELKQSVVLHVVSAHPGSDAVHGCLVVPKELVVAKAGRCPVLTFMVDDDTPRTTPGHVEAPPASECIGIFAVRDNFIVGLVVFHCKFDPKFVLRWIAEAGACISFQGCCEAIGPVVAFYVLVEQIHRGAVVFVETLNLDQKLTADHELFRVVFGLQAGNPRCYCWACETETQDERRGAPAAQDRTYASLVAHAALFPRGGKTTNAYKGNLFRSVEHAPMLRLEPTKDTSFAPLHNLLGEFLRLYKVLASKCASIDGVLDADAATRIAALLLAAKERCEELARAAIEVCVQQGKVKKTLELATARVTGLRAKIEKKEASASQSARPGVQRNASKALLGARQLLEEACEDEAAKRNAFEALRPLLDHAVAERTRAWADLANVEAQAVTLGPMSKRLGAMLDELRIKIQAFYQMFIGNHCYKLLKNARRIFDELSKVARATGEGAAAEFEEYAKTAVPLWESLYTVTRLSLAARILTDDEVAVFKVACLSYQLQAYGSDDSNALKRHMYTHLWKFAEVNRTVGLFAESAFESIHARNNAIERRYLHMVWQQAKDEAIRKALALQQDREARAARAAHHAAVARGPRPRPQP
ncbi:hypothetical protein M885DRAFT_573807 [Pelagophyceae sp. CCMP2097]|nr:hypothetical protein M885DRAFT_573807 [Pelagophyceae sp. CCMP2097]